MKTQIFGAWIVLFLAVEVFGSQYVTLEMDWHEDSHPSVEQRGIQEHVEDGFHLRPIFRPMSTYSLTHNKGVTDMDSYNGGPYLQLAWGNSLEVFALDGSPFNVISIDLAEYSVLYDIWDDVGFRGYLADGSHHDVTFRIDGIVDSFGPLEDFETFFFPETFNDIVRLEATTTLYSLDNLVVEVVPEPGTLMLLGLGGLVCRSFIGPEN